MNDEVISHLLDHAAPAAMAMQPPSSSSSSSVDNNSNRMNKQGLWSNVRSAMRGIRRTVLQSTVLHDSHQSHDQDNDIMNTNNNNGENMMMMYNNLFDRHGDGAAVNNMSVLRVGGDD